MCSGNRSFHKRLIIFFRLCTVRLTSRGVFVSNLFHIQILISRLVYPHLFSLLQIQYILCFFGCYHSVRFEDFFINLSNSGMKYTTRIVHKEQIKTIDSNSFKETSIYDIIQEHG